MTSLIIGTRGSKLAHRQAELFAEAICRAVPVIRPEFKIVATRGDVWSSAGRALGRTSPRGRRGDLARERPSRRVSEKSLFTKELEDELLAGHIDVAVHSGKDLASKTPPGLAIGAVLPRGDRSDAFCSGKIENFDSLPEGATVGTSSIRRRAQILLRRPDLKIVSLRGNVDTRLGKLAEGQCDALILATAGLERLGLEHAIKERFNTKTFLPAPAQAAITIQYRIDRDEVGKVLRSVSDDAGFCEVKAERALLERLEAGCWIPLGASAEVRGERLSMTAGLFSPGGEQSVVRSLEGSAKDPVALGWEMAKVILREGGQQILDELREFYEETNE